MSFLDKIEQVTRPKVTEAKFDFGDGDGEETVRFQVLNYTQRKKILVDRITVIGKDKDGNEQRGVPQSQLFEMNAEILAASFIRPDGKPVSSKEDFMTKWDSNLVDKLAALCFKTIGLFDDEKKKDPEENPSTAQS